jgi:uncharacterized membrane protein YuzA (DUF378 family)
MMITSHRTSAMRVVAALLTGLAGVLAFNVIDGVFGVPEAIVGLVVSIAVTVFVARRSSPPEAEPDA